MKEIETMKALKKEGGKVENVGEMSGLRLYHGRRRCNGSVSGLRIAQNRI